MFKYDVLCVGSAVVDRFLTIDQPLNSVKLGDKILAKSLEIHTGGGGTNSAVALAKFGLKVRLFTKLGKDHEADFIESELKKYGIKTVCKCVSKHLTDSSTIISSTYDKDRVVYNYKSASQDLDFCHCPKSSFKPKWIYLASLVGKSFQTAKELAIYAHKKKIKLLFNPSLYLTKKGKKYLQEVLAVTDILVLNDREAQVLLNSKSNNIKYLLKELQSLGPKNVVITSGPKTVYGLYENVIYSLTPPKVKVANTLGAGDSFTSALLAGIMKGYSFEDALRLGQANSTSLIQKVGTKTGLLTEKEALRIMKKYRMKVKRY
ncbi:MAG: carbohydrate kinase family protein [Candidatus Woesearchaeota archaeon]